MPDARVTACPHLREELTALAAPLGLPLAFEGRDCPCLAPSRPGAAAQAGPALLCGLVRPGAPPTGFHLVAPGAVVDGLLAEGAHLVTAGWLRDWRRRLAELGLDEAAARRLYGEGARRVVLLDAGLGVDAGEELAAFAAHVGLPAERRLVGPDHLRLRVELATAARRAGSAEQRAADQAAVLDLLADIRPVDPEAAVASRFLSLLQLLVAPARALYLPLAGGAGGEPILVGDGDGGPLEAALRAMSPGAEAAALSSGDGFLLRLGPPGLEAGRLGCEGVRFPQNLERYLDVGHTLAHACFLSVSRARAVEALQRSEADLRRHRDHLDALVAERTAELTRTVAEREAALEKARLLSGLLPICFGCKKIRDDSGYWTQLEVYISAHSDATFSHGLCEECLERLYPEIK